MSAKTLCVRRPFTLLTRAPCTPFNLTDWMAGQEGNYWVVRCLHELTRVVVVDTTVFIIY